jgi:hypothetical protein
MVKDLETTPYAIHHIIYILQASPKYHQVLFENNIIPTLIQLLNTMQVMNDDVYLCLLLLAKNFVFTANPSATCMYARYCNIPECALKFPNDDKKFSFDQEQQDIREKIRLSDYTLLVGLSLFSGVEIDLSRVEYYILGESDIRYNIIKMLIWCGVKILPESGAFFKKPIYQNLLPSYQRIQVGISGEFSRFIATCESSSNAHDKPSGRFTTLVKIPNMGQLLKPYVTGL